MLKVTGNSGQIENNLFNDTKKLIENYYLQSDDFDNNKLIDYIRKRERHREKHNTIDFLLDNRIEQERCFENIFSRLSNEGFNLFNRQENNISISRGTICAYIDFFKEYPEYGYPVARFRDDIKSFENDERIVPYLNGNCKYSVRNGTFDKEKFNIGITCDNDLDLVIRVLKKLLT